MSGTATLFRGARAGVDVHAPHTEPLRSIHRRLKSALDPAGILNPGRLYADL
jgi:glycolate oxidase FAD binding subunit